MSGIVLPRLLRVASFRFAALYVALFAGSAFVLGMTVFVEARSALQQQMTARVEMETSLLKDDYAANGLHHLVGTVEVRGKGPSALDYLVQDYSGAHLAGEMPAVPGLSRGWTIIDVPQASEDNGRPERVRALVSPLNDGVLLAIGSDVHQIGELEEAIATALLWTVGLAAALGIGGGALISRTFLHKVDTLVRTVEAIISGDFARRLPVSGTGDDLDRLARTLNRMLDRIAALMESLRQVSSDVAHDLRTPLTRLYQRLEDVHAHARSVADFEPAVEAALKEAQGLLETFSALLRIAQVEGASPRAEFRRVDLSAAAEAVADAYRPDAEEAGHQLSTAITAGVVVSGDQELLTQALANLVENALRHTPPGTRISIRLESCSDGGARLSVEDNGPGVADADLPHLTERFFRGEPSRTMPGNGLGLSLVNAIAELHFARLTFANSDLGLNVSVSFPAHDVGCVEVRDDGFRHW